jgi:hypothetical protein
VTVHHWKRMTLAQRDAVESEAVGLPIPGADARLRVVWD